MTGVRWGGMLSPRAPLFSVSLALALGCLLGLDGWISLRVALFLFAMAGLAWWFLARFEGASLAAFYVFVAAGGIVHTLLLAGTIAPEDLRRLPEEKTYPTTQWRGVVIEEPVAQLSPHTAHHGLDRTSFVLDMEAWRPTGGRFFNAPVDAPWQTAQGRVRCLLIGPTQELKCGDLLEFATALDPVDAPLSPGDLDRRLFEGEQNIYYHATLTSQNWRRTQSGVGDFWQTFSYQARDWAYARLQIGIEDDPRTADFLAGMLIGYRQEIPADIEQNFRRTGTLHVFAVSGQKVAELMVVVIVLLQLCGFVRWRWAWTLTPVVLIYCLLTGSPASAVRATVMVLAVLAAWRLGRPLNALGCWSIALIAMLLWSPLVLLDPGAQLSFGVVLGLILIAPRLGRIIAARFAHDPFLPSSLLSVAQRREQIVWHYFLPIIATTIAATLVSEPITAVDFHQVTPIAVLANVIVIPMTGLITVVGTLAVTCSLVSTTWAALLNNANWFFARFLIALVGFLAHEPGASINVPDVRAAGFPPPSFVVAPLPGSACLLVRTGSGTWLFNTGRDDAAQQTTFHLLQFFGVNQLDGLVLTQMSLAESGGAGTMVRDFHPRRLVIPALRTRSPMEKAMPDTIALAGRPAESWHEGQSLALGGGISVDVLAPADQTTNTHAQDRGLVLLFHDGGQTLLWAGKIDAPAQQALLAAHPGLRADVIVLSPDALPTENWLRSLKVREWLQMPRADARANITSTENQPESWDDWPLDQTGAVGLRFLPATKIDPPKIVLHPWVDGPEAQNQAN
jgi:ComEC/Rec2-related protein